MVALDLPHGCSVREPEYPGPGAVGIGRLRFQRLRVTDMWAIWFMAPHVSDPKSPDAMSANLSPT